MSADQDSVRRLAEARDHMLLWMSRLPAHEHLYEADYFPDCRACALVAEKAAAIDSLTAERDGLRRDFEQVRRMFLSAQDYRRAWKNRFNGIADQYDAVVARAEAAEADRERLREALMVCFDAFDQRYDGAPDSRAQWMVEPMEAARAALATPPSEGEQS